MLQSVRVSSAAGVVLAIWITDGSAVAQAVLPDPWTLTRELQAPANAAAACDTVRGKVVLFGGRPWVAYSSDTWQWDGMRWTLHSTSGGPSARMQHAMAYDAARRVVVLFGGMDSNGYALGTWLFDGVAWQRAPVAKEPGPRLNAAMAFDAARGVTILFGGDRGTLLADTWQWDGARWTELPVNGPRSRHSHGLAYDPRRQRIVLHGGYREGTHPLQDTWEWDGRQWLATQPANLPPGMHGAASTYDPGLGRFVLFGAEDETTSFWQWDGRDWSRVPYVPVHPRARRGGLLIADTAHDKLMLVGGAGVGEEANINYRGTWLWDGVRWVEQQPDRGLRGGIVVYDSSRQRLVALDIRGAHWEWDGFAWQRDQRWLQGPQRMLAAMAFDGSRNEIVLFGGADGTQRTADTFTWSSSSGWRLRQPASSPPALQAHSMTYDRARQRVLLFGEAGLWEWDGQTWHPRRAPGAEPEPRWGAGFAYDDARRVSVLFGGDGWSGELNDTWCWDGSVWRRQPSQVEPIGRRNPVFAYDAARRRIVMFGGSRGWWTSWSMADTWEWNGASWGFVSRMSEGAAGSGVYVEHLGAMVHLDFRGLTWAYARDARIESSPLGSGCAGGGTVPRLGSNLPYVGNPRFALELVEARPRAAGLFILSLGIDPRPVGGECVLYLRDPLLPFGVTTTAAGYSELVMPIPLELQLRGMRVHAQAFIDDPGPMAPGFAASAARKLVIGD